MSTNLTISLTEIPEEIILYTCNFLCLIDLLKLELSCKYLCKLSRNPNAVFKLYLPNIFYSVNDNRLSRIKSLDINDGWKHLTWTANTNWAVSVNELCVTVTTDKYYSSAGLHLPYFSNVQKCILYRSANMLFTASNFKLDALTNLELTELKCCHLNETFVNAIIQCVNIQTFALTLDSFGVNKAAMANNNMDNNPMFNDIQTNPFTKLKRFETCVSMTRFPNFFHWILCSAQKDKTLTLYGGSEDENEMKLFSVESRLSVSAFRKMKEICFEAEDLEKIDILLLYNVESMIRNSGKSIVISLDVSWRIYENVTGRGAEYEICPLIKLLPFCQSSELFIEFLLYLFEDDESAVMDNQIVLDKIDNKSFERLLVCVDVFWCDGQFYDNSLDAIQNIEQLQKWGHQCAMDVVNKYNKFLKPWLKMNRYRMENIGMKKFEVFMNVSNEYLRPSDETMSEYWDKHVISQIQQTISDHCDNNCEIKFDGLISISFKITICS